MEAFNDRHAEELGDNISHLEVGFMADRGETLGLENLSYLRLESYYAVLNKTSSHTNNATLSSYQRQSTALELLLLSTACCLESSAIS
jgi:hypothetical protein